MPRQLRALSVALFALLSALTILAQDTAHGEPDDTVTLTAPAPNTVIAESDDYATKVVGNPWDMSDPDDLDWLLREPDEYQPADVPMREEEDTA